MPRVNVVNRARKAQGTCGKCGTVIDTGTTYRWWKFRFGGRHVRCMKVECNPKAGDLTQSEFLSSIYGIESDLEAITSCDCVEDATSILEDAASRLRELGDECRDKRYNMPEGLQEGDVGLLLEERADACEEKVSELEDAISDLENAELYDSINEFLDDFAADHPEYVDDANKAREAMENHNREQLEDALSSIDTSISID
jgi:hypothetical protein